MKILAAAALVFVSVVANLPAFATGMGPQPLPIDRLLATAEADRAANAASPEAHYLVARIHYLAFAYSAREVQALGGRGNMPGRPLESYQYPASQRAALQINSSRLDDEASRQTEQEMGGPMPAPRGNPAAANDWRAALSRNQFSLQQAASLRAMQALWNGPNALSADEMIRHAAEAISGYREAIRLERAGRATPAPPAVDLGLGPRGMNMAAPRDGRAQLGLATVLEQFADWKTGRTLPVQLKPLPRSPNASPILEGGAFPPTVTLDDLRRLDLAQARDAYLLAYRTAYPSESGRASLPLDGLESLISFEAGTAFLRLATRDPAASTEGTELAKTVAEVKAGVDKVTRIPRGGITPMVFSLRPVGGVQELLATNVVVDFDLRGFGPAERWPWVKPETGILVWDPLRRGVIDSARQLFGSYTFEIFWKDGYAPLAALDTNRDGVLASLELEGIRAWFDTNSDGRSEPAEVKDLAGLGITGIETRATASEGPHLTNSRGLHFGDKRSLPTWDWIAEPLPPLP